MKPAESSANPTVLVTGASRGIGRAIAGQLALRGCRVAVHYRGDAAAAGETLAALAADLDQVKTAVLEAPALLELGARCSLARSFIYSRPGATPGAAPLFSFDAKAFESAWLYLCGGDEPAQPPAGS